MRDRQPDDPGVSADEPWAPFAERRARAARTGGWPSLVSDESVEQLAAVGRSRDWALAFGFFIFAVGIVGLGFLFGGGR